MRLKTSKASLISTSMEDFSRDPRKDRYARETGQGFSGEVALNTVLELLRTCVYLGAEKLVFWKSDEIVRVLESSAHVGDQGE